MSILKRKKENEILVLIDWLNISLSLYPAGQLELTDFDRLIKKISREVGEIANVFVFAPNLTSREGETFYKQGFYVINCPKVKTKEGEDKDTTDEILINFLKDVVPDISGLTHICLGSGDKDFCQALRNVIRKDLRLMIVAGNLTSLSSDLIELADVNPLTHKKMVYLLLESK